MQLIVFAAYAIASQALLIAYFASRRWARGFADRWGWIAYAFGVVGLPVGAWLAVAGSSWRLFVGPLLFAAWAAYGAWVDVVRRIDWRPMTGSVRRPVNWTVLGPYVTLYLAAQMFLWWPMWDYWRQGWVVYLVLFVANTALNLAGHSGSSTRPRRRMA